MGTISVYGIAAVRQTYDYLSYAEDKVLSITSSITNRTQADIKIFEDDIIRATQNQTNDTTAENQSHLKQ